MLNVKTYLFDEFIRICIYLIYKENVKISNRRKSKTI